MSSCHRFRQEQNRSSEVEERKRLKEIISDDQMKKKYQSAEDNQEKNEGHNIDKGT